jgi:ribosome biogenesis GTPase
VIFTSALKGTGIKQFGERILGRQSILVGYSGVGKTSLLNSLFPDLDLPVSEISDSTGKGRHTTTTVQMVHAGGNTRIIDTPGLREFGLMDIEPHLLERYFPEFSPYRDECEYRPCTHDHEPNCAVKLRIEEGAISEDRYISYLNILHSLEDYYKRMY